MSNLEPKNTESLLKKLLGTVSSLQKEVSELKEENRMIVTSRTYPKKRPCDGDAGAGLTTEGTRDGEDTSSDSEHKGNCDSETEGHGGDKKDDTSVIYQLSDEGEAFLENAFASRLKYQTRQSKVAKYGMPDTKWLQCL